METIKRSELTDDKNRQIYPNVHFKIFEDGLIDIACEVETNYGYLMFVRKQFAFNGNINLLEDFLVEFEKNVAGVKNCIPENISDIFYCIKIIEDK